jgi:hypothetical protein
MASQEKAEEIAQRMAQQERLIARLYGLYATAFPKDAEMWSRLASDEQEHAEWAESACDFCAAGMALSGWTRFPVEELEDSIRQIHEAIDAAQPGQTDREAALASALRIERGMAEKEFFTIVEAAPQPVMDIMARLASGTRAHIGALEAASTRQ